MYYLPLFWLYACLYYRVEREKQQLKSEIGDLQDQMSNMSKKGGMSEKMSKQVEAQISDLTAQLEDKTRAINDMQFAKSKLQNENSELGRQLEEAENRATQLAREQSSLQSALEEAKRSLEEEIRVSLNYVNLLVIDNWVIYSCLLLSVVKLCWICQNVNYH